MIESAPGDVPSDWVERYREQGYLNIPDLLSADTVRRLRAAFDELEQQGSLQVGEEELIDHTDIIFLHEAFSSVLREPRVVALLTALLGPRVELYDTKFINKPLKATGFSSFTWHQDFAFYPHTNHDMLAFAIHLDDEDERSGPVRLVPGSHRLGPLPHSQNGQFLHRLPQLPPGAERDSILLTGSAGFVTVHHCLMVHCSDPKERYGHRRVAYYDVRAQDNVQLAGYLRRSAGWEVTPRPPGESRYARFPDGSRIELRGASGRLCDPFGLLASSRGHAGPET